MAFKEKPREEQAEAADERQDLDRRRAVVGPRGRQVVAVQRRDDDHEALEPHADVHENRDNKKISSFCRGWSWRRPKKKMLEKLVCHNVFYCEQRYADQDNQIFWTKSLLPETHQKKNWILVFNLNPNLVLSCISRERSV